MGIAGNKRAAAQLIVALASVDKQAFDAVTRPDTRWWTAGMPGTYSRDEYFQFSKDASLLLKQPDFQMQPVGITSHPAAPSIEEFLSHYESVSGISVANRSWYRALNAYKMAVICLIGSMLFDSGDSDDQRFLLNAYGISPLTQLGLAELAVDEKLEDGPVMPRNL